MSFRLADNIRYNRLDDGVSSFRLDDDEPSFRLDEDILIEGDSLVNEIVILIRYKPSRKKVRECTN